MVDLSTIKLGVTCNGKTFKSSDIEEKMGAKIIDMDNDSVTFEYEGEEKCVTMDKGAVCMVMTNKY